MEICAKQISFNFMSKRTLIPKALPEAYRAMIAFDKYIGTTSLSTVHKDLIKIRASQVNGCAYCIDMHCKEARDAGESERRIYALSAWKDTPFFTEEERALLALTEEVTLIQHHVSDETYDRVVTLLGEKYASEAIMAIIVINAWNRIGIATGLQPAVR